MWVSFNSANSFIQVIQGQRCHQKQKTVQPLSPGKSNKVNTGWVLWWRSIKLPSSRIKLLELSSFEAVAAFSKRLKLNQPHYEVNSEPSELSDKWKEPHRRLLLVDEVVVDRGRAQETGHVVAVLGHDQLDGVLVLLQRSPQLLVLVLELADVTVLLLYAWNTDTNISINNFWVRPQSSLIHKRGWLLRLKIFLQTYKVFNPLHLLIWMNALWVMFPLPYFSLIDYKRGIQRSVVTIKGLPMFGDWRRQILLSNGKENQLKTWGQHCKRSTSSTRCTPTILLVASTVGYVSNAQIMVKLTAKAFPQRHWQPLRVRTWLKTKDENHVSTLRFEL